MVKRMFDLMSSIIILIFLSIPLLILYVSVWIKLGRPVIFKQVRPGIKGNPFKMYKFRSMTDTRDKTGQLLPDKDRLTSFGRFLRASSLDELPELINVFKGEMSLVGPRPLLIEYLPRYSKEQFKRHNVLPGITGWAQVNGRNAITWEEKFSLDIWYVENRSFFLDFKILLMTLKKVFRRDGITHTPGDTMPPFKG